MAIMQDIRTIDTLSGTNVYALVVFKWRLTDKMLFVTNFKGNI